MRCLVGLCHYAMPTPITNFLSNQLKKRIHFFCSLLRGGRVIVYALFTICSLLPFYWCFTDLGAWMCIEPTHCFETHTVLLYSCINTHTALCKPRVTQYYRSKLSRCCWSTPTERIVQFCHGLSKRTECFGSTRDPWPLTSLCNKQLGTGQC